MSLGDQGSFLPTLGGLEGVSSGPTAFLGEIQPRCWGAEAPVWGKPLSSLSTRRELRKSNNGELIKLLRSGWVKVCLEHRLLLSWT